MRQHKESLLSYFQEMTILSFRILVHKVSNYDLSPQSAYG
jgi:hypothetical protein